MSNSAGVTRLTAERLLDIASVAERLACSTKTVRRLIASGQLIPHRIGRTVRVSESDLHAFLNQRRG